MLDQADPHVRLWTARLLCDKSRVSPGLAAALARRAAIEPNVEVRSQLACSARRLPARDALPIVRALLARSEDAGDIHIPMLVWWAIESKAGSDPAAVLAMFEDPSIWRRPIVQRTIVERLMRRFAATGTRADLDRCARLLAMAPGPDDEKRLMAGFEAAYAGRSLAGLPAGLADAVARYSKQSLSLGLRQGAPRAVAEALRLLADDRADRAKVLQILQVMGEVRTPAVVSAVLKLACHSADNALRSAALSTLAAYDDPAIASEVLAAYANMSDDVQDSAQRLLATRRDRAARFVEAIESRSINARAVPREVVDKLALVGGPDVTERISRSSVRSAPRAPPSCGPKSSGWPPSYEPDRVCRSRENSSSTGRARCHTLFSQGGKVGPDLTTYRRDDLDTMLLNIVNPSAEIREGFSTSIVATTDGRVLTGVVVEQDKNVVVLRVNDGKELTIAREDIDAVKASPKSLMPEGLLSGLGDQEIRDLFAYLRSTQPLID